MGIREHYGLNRVVCAKSGIKLQTDENKNPDRQNMTVFPQNAYHLDNIMNCGKQEIKIKVETLNIDSSSFHQLYEEASHNEEKLKDLILNIVISRGKMHNPTTNSGGMLLGKVIEIGQDFHNYNENSVKIGDRVCTLVSLTLTPLKINKILSIDITSEKVFVDAEAILFSSGIFSVLPKDFSQNCALSILDVCGAPAWAIKNIGSHERVAILGAGKSGLLTAFACLKNIKKPQNISIYDINEDSLKSISALNSLFQVEKLNLLDLDKVFVYLENLTTKFDTVFLLTNVKNCELPAILLTKKGGRILFFSMLTEFTQAALGAEGIGADVNLIIGNGYVTDHDKMTFELINEYPELKKYLENKYGN